MVIMKQCNHKYIVDYSNERTWFGRFQIFISDHSKLLSEYCKQAPKQPGGAILGASSGDAFVKILHEQMDGNLT